MEGPGGAPADHAHACPHLIPMLPARRCPWIICYGRSHRQLPRKGAIKSSTELPAPLARGHLLGLLPSGSLGRGSRGQPCPILARQAALRDMAPALDCSMLTLRTASEQPANCFGGMGGEPPKSPVPEGGSLAPTTAEIPRKILASPCPGSGGLRESSAQRFIHPSIHLPHLPAAGRSPGS